MIYANIDIKYIRKYFYFLCHFLCNLWMTGFSCLKIMNLLSRIRKYPIIWDTIKFGSLFTAAEITQQIIGRKIINDEFKLRSKEEREKLDWGSVFRFSIWGFAIFPHILRKWYRILDSGIITGSSMRQAVLKTFIDQAIFPGEFLSKAHFHFLKWKFSLQCPFWRLSTCFWARWKERLKVWRL